MVQGLSLSTLTTSGNGGFSGSTALWRRHFKLIEKSHIGIDRQCFCHQFVQGLHSRVNFNLIRQRNLRVDAGWLFKGGSDQGMDASSERSESANEDILFFFFQLDLATRVQV